MTVKNCKTAFEKPTKVWDETAQDNLSKSQILSIHEDFKLFFC